MQKQEEEEDEQNIKKVCLIFIVNCERALIY